VNIMSDYKINLEKPAVRKKIEQVEQTIGELKNYPTVALIDLKKLPDALLQKTRQKIREDGGKILILKKPVIERVMKSNTHLATRVDECEKPLGLILTKKSPFELYKFFKTNKKKRAAKPGDIAPFEIIVPEGDTDLPPGPALSELKGAGINVQIKGGKIVVAKDSTVAKEGDKINDAKAKALQKLGVLPFDVSVTYLFGYDGQYIYNSDLFTIDETIAQDIQSGLSDAFNLSINANYPTSANADILLTQAISQSMNIALNGELYSTIAIEQLLTSATRQGLALSGLEAASPKEEPDEVAKAAEPAGDAPAEVAAEAKETEVKQE
jgi:large subunit ribosomal protein L10